MAKNKVIENIQEVVWVKNELRNILLAVGMNPSDKFEEYAGNFITALEQIENISQAIVG